MKKLVFLATTLLMFLAITVNAQQRGPRERMTPEQQATRTVERLTTELKLTDKQQADLKKWYTESFKKREEAMQQNRDNREAMRDQMKKDREAADAELKKVLTEEQYKTYKANEEKRMKEVVKVADTLNDKIIDNLKATTFRLFFILALSPVHSSPN